MNNYIPWLYPALITYAQGIFLLIFFSMIVLLNIIREVSRHKKHKAQMKVYKKMREEL